MSGNASSARAPSRTRSAHWGENVEEIVESMGAMKFGARPPAWVFAFPACKESSGHCSGSQETLLSAETRDEIIKNVFSNLQLFKEEEAQHRTGERPEKDHGYKYFQSLDELDKGVVELTVTTSMSDVYQKLLMATDMWGMRTNILELLLVYFSTKHCGLNARAFSSNDGRELFLAISISEPCLIVTADALNYELQFCKTVAKGIFGAIAEEFPDVPYDADEPFLPYDLQEDFKFRSKFQGQSAFRVATDEPGSVVAPVGSHVPCNCEWNTNEPDEENRTTRNADSPMSTPSLFRSADRIRLTRRLIECLFSIDALEDVGIISVAYCCHDQKTRVVLEREWASLRNICSIALPLEMIREYCGENVAFRFAFMQFTAVTLLPLALVAPVVRHADLSSLHMTTVFGIALFAWTQFMLKFWSRREAALRLKWGMEHFGEKEVVRARFKGKWVTSDVNGVDKIKVADGFQVFRRLGVQFATLSCMLAMLSCVLLMLCWKVKYAPSTFQFAAVNISQVQFFRRGWHTVAMSLTELENHRTVSHFRTAYSQRIFWFLLMNTMVPLLYLAFVKVFYVGCAELPADSLFGRTETYFYSGDYGSCGSELAMSLISLFIVDMFVEIMTVTPILKSPKLMLLSLCSCLRQRPAILATRTLKARYASIVTLDETPSFRALNATRPKSFFAKWWDHPQYNDPQPGYVEMQRHMPEFDFEQQANTRARNIVDLCMMSFFGMACPEIVTILTCGLFLRNRIFGRRLVLTMRRAEPIGSDGLGTWYNIINGVFVMAAVCNLFYLILHNSMLPPERDLFLPLKRAISTMDENVPREKDWKAMLAVALAVEHAIVVPIIGLVMVFIPSEHPHTAMHRHRRAHVSWAYNKVLSDTKENGEMDRVMACYQKERLYYLDADGDEYRWRSAGQVEDPAASVMDLYGKQLEGDQCIAWCPGGKIPEPPAGAGAVDEDRLFAKSLKNPWGLAGCFE